jgi:hypothetical protein
MHSTYFRKIILCLIPITALLLLILKHNNYIADPEDLHQESKSFPLTLISGYFNISRSDRPKDTYFEWIESTIKLNAPFIFFTQPQFKTEIERIFMTSKKNLKFKIITIELEELAYYNDIHRVEEILASDEYKAKITNPERIECTNPMYSIVIYSKMNLLLKSAELNPFNSTQFIWVDAGISRFFRGFNLKRKLSGKTLSSSSFFIACEKRAFDDIDFKQRNETGFIWSARNYFLAGIMGGTYDTILKVTNELRKKWTYLLEEKRTVNNEQHALMLVYFDWPKMFNLKVFENKNWNLRHVFESLV